jgi:hypothetical protein
MNEPNFEFEQGFENKLPLLTVEQVRHLTSYLSGLTKMQEDAQEKIDPFAHDSVRRASVENRLPTPEEYQTAIESAKQEGRFWAIKEITDEINKALDGDQN